MICLVVVVVDYSCTNRYCLQGQDDHITTHEQLFIIHFVRASLELTDCQLSCFGGGTIDCVCHEAAVAPLVSLPGIQHGEGAGRSASVRCTISNVTHIPLPLVGQIASHGLHSEHHVSAWINIGLIRWLAWNQCRRVNWMERRKQGMLTQQCYSVSCTYHKWS